ncbi:uncharacterized protein LOC130704107 [Daphnia carinata]|uniref:uncharacterized protein LOC130704107 n=1 Tax=Daphnia carinata TaxID=120202 RepID=UPI00257FF850|nr:uncharacterized protein LOC130704107 [Daphnia carinata]
MEKIKGYKDLTMTAELDNDIATDTELLKQRYQKFIKASDQVRWALQNTNATEEQIEQDYSTVAEVEEEMSSILAFRKEQRQIEEDRNRLLQDLLTQQQQLFATQILQQQQAHALQIQQLMAQNQAPVQVAAAAAPIQQATRLPQRQIKHFKGDILEWTSFWESFNASIHSSTMSDVQKFDYLKEYLKGEAYLCVENLELTAANYNIAIAELKRVYAKPKALIQTHLCKFDNLAPVKTMADVSALRKLQLTVQSHINALETLGVRKESFGGLLGTKLMKLLPAELQKEWSSSEENDITDIASLLNFIRDEVDAAERYSRWKSETTKTPQQSTSPSPAKPIHAATASQLAIGARSQPAPHTSKNSRQFVPPSNTPFRRQDNFIMRECTRPCIFCGEVHYPTVCPVNLKEKKAIIAKLKRCVRCFSANHETLNCTTNYTCKHCQAIHHTALCDKKQTRFAHQTVNGNSAITNVTASAASANTPGNLVVKTATVNVVGPNGKQTRAILFIDDGSHRSWVTRSISKLLDLKVVAVENIGTRVFKQRKPNPVEKTNSVELTFRGTWHGAPLVKITALETDYIGDTGPYAHTTFAQKLWLDNERMADDRFETNSQEKDVGILIGVDQMFEIIPNEAAIQSPCGLRAYNTKLGRMIVGPSKEKNSKKGKALIQQMLQCSSFSAQSVASYAAGCLNSNYTFTTLPEEKEKTPDVKEKKESSSPHPTSIEEISIENSIIKKEKKKIVKEELKRQTDFDLSLFWKLEHFAILDDCDAVEPDDPLGSFGDKITRQEDGRYCTPIPWKTDKWRLEKNFLMAKGRLESLLNRLKKTPALLSAYHQEIEQLRVQNFVEKADLNYDGLHTYLPHHPVIRQDKTTTKIRPVFDGAAKSKFGPSLNDVLETGPNLNPDLLAVLMRFRLNRIAWIADIEKAFLNIALHPEDSEAVRFLWVTEPETSGSPLVAYKWKRVPFGLSSSPFLLRVTLNKHLDGMEPLYSTTVKQLKEQIYVDDYLGGADSIPTAKNRIQETKAIFQEAKLNMRSWVTNDKTLRKFLSEKGLINPIVKIFTQKLEEGQPKVLGIRWDTESDTFQFDPAPIIEAATELGDLVTKRNILRISARVFDPIGFLAPTTLLLKIIYQKLWEAEIDWDVEAPPEIAQTWITAMTGLNEFAKLKIPRWIGHSKRVIQSAEIHVFGDASEAAYGAVAYARLQTKNNETSIHFLASKTKVAPLPKKKVTLPRLELLGSLLAARLGEKLKNFLHTESWRTIFWTDSLVALGWIRGDPNRWKPFVRNQVEAIRKLSGVSWWRHCPGIHNPADLASRGAPASALVHSELWWNGPPWLKEETEWPDSTPDAGETSIHEKIEAEAKGKTVIMSVATVEPATPMEWQLERIPSWNRLLRRTAWMLRFLHKNRPINRTQIRTPIKIGDEKEILVDHLTVEELTKAELLIYRQLQKEAFPKTFQDLQEGRQPHHKEKIAKLRPVWDERDKLIRVTGRVELALRDRDIEPAILLPTHHPVVKLLIADRHVSLKHAGVKTTLSDLRERFWIIKGRQQTKSVWHACVKCQRLTSPPFTEVAAPLPLNRLKQAKAFEITGVDFAGPLYYKHPISRKKRKQAELTTSVDPPQTDDPSVETPAEPPAMEQTEEKENLQPDDSGKKKKGTIKQPKSYACLFTCAVTRAVHLELTKTMSARDFLLAFRRFSARRGLEIRSSDP